ncbi:MAG: hypothetical protein LBI49_07730 [Nocardiopsaceae bacterium]|jgi:hypothetical protein|nr:hypothetical protein [Nocardiopsaceae bacterium]
MSDGTNALSKPVTNINDWIAGKARAGTPGRVPGVPGTSLRLLRGVPEA